MAEVAHAPRVTVSLDGPIELERGAPRKRGAKAPKRTTPAPAEPGALIQALQRQDLQLVTTVPLKFAAAARPKKRGGVAPLSTVTLDVPLAADEQAVVLLDDEGEYRWVVNGKELAAPAPKRRGAPAKKRQVRFRIELKAAPAARSGAAKRGAVKRNWLVDKLAGKVVAYVFRFAVNVAGKHVVAFLERNVEQGLVSIEQPDPQQWKRLADDAPLPSPLPPDRRARVLLFVHGTFSSTVGSFGALGIVPKARDFLGRAFAHYDVVLGFDHPTLSVDPLRNAQDLLARLRKIAWPQPPHVDIVAFSRGGLVARSLLEHLLPGAGWPVTIGRVVFVGCTNSGTQLAEPANWHRFADHYTNLALGATRALSLIPGAQGWTAIAGQVIQGVGALVKVLATGVVADKVVPGLAAMEPDGDFVRNINAAQAGQPKAADAHYYAVCSNFEAGKALSSGGTPELPPKLLMRIADWGADELYGEANDLVVHVRSMTAIDPTFGDFIKDKLDYGTNGLVYHTNYFTRDRTAARLIEWFELPQAAAPAPKRRAKRAVKPAAKNVLKRKGSAVARAASVAKAAPKKALKKKVGGGGRAAGAPRAMAKKMPKRGLVKKAKKAAAKKSAKPISRSGRKGRFDFIRTDPNWTTAGARLGSDRILGTGPGGRSPEAGRRTRSMPIPPRQRITEAPPAAPVVAPAALPPIAPPSRSPKRSAKRPAAAKSPARNGNGGGATTERKAGAATAARVECHFRAEMDSEVVVNKTASVDVTVARHALEVDEGRAGDTAAATVEADRKLIVQIAERRNFRVDGERRVEIDVPAPGEEAHLSFDVTGLVAGDGGELWVTVRQGPVPLATLKLKPAIVAKAGAKPPARQPVESDVERLPAPEEPLDQLLIEESFVGDAVKYRYYFDLPTLRLRKRFESKTIDGRDAYITKVLNRIGDAWAGTGKDQLEAFETDLKSIGAQMFTDLMPREMQEFLWDNRERIRSVQVFSMEPFIPWELVYLKNPKDDVIDDKSRFLGELGLARWLYDGYPPKQLAIGAGRARYIIPTYTGDNVLPDAADEERMMKSLFKATPVKARARDVQNLLKTEGSFDLLHFGGHAEAAGADRADARLLLDELGDDSTENALLATTVAQTAKLNADGHQPIVVLNACESGRMHRSFASMGGFASAFVSRGAGVFVGTHWSVGDAPAHTFIEAFYKAFAVRKPGAKPLELREAVAQARKAARKGGDATWLAYVVYGHPRAVVN